MCHLGPGMFFFLFFVIHTTPTTASHCSQGGGTPTPPPMRRHPCPRTTSRGGGTLPHCLQDDLCHQACCSLALLLQWTHNNTAVSRSLLSSDNDNDDAMLLSSPAVIEGARNCGSPEMQELLSEGRRRVMGTGKAGVQVRVRSREPAGYPCGSLPERIKGPLGGGRQGGWMGEWRSMWFECGTATSRCKGGNAAMMRANGRLRGSSGRVGAVATAVVVSSQIYMFSTTQSMQTATVQNLRFYLQCKK